ncbi:MAG: acetate--CoA ligase family protein [Anaerolineaceae bacterium]|nr:acetate--CoA ligase family protein [Anaerolineaceae bacterium]
MPSSLKPFFNATGVAILGASTNPKKLSYGILKNLVDFGYQGEIYPVNPKADQILGKRAYATVADVPDPVELAVVVLPVTMIMETMREIGERGIKTVVIITGGFKELGPDGAEIEKSVKKLADEYGMRVVGPNCVGTMDIRTGLNSTFIAGMPPAGPIAFISQSGAICGGVIDLIINAKIGFSHIASLGNMMDVTETDMLEYFAEDEHVKVIAMYVEGLKDGQRFMRVAREVSRRKPIVFLKAGKNGAGAKAVSSHTGSLAGSYAAYQSAVKQAGVIEVSTISELFNLAWALGCQPLPKGKRVAITTNAGGAAALAADSLDFNGFELATIAPETQSRLREKLNPSAQVTNPVDMLGSVSPEDYFWSLSNLEEDDGVDVLIPILVPQALVDTPEVAKAWVEIGRKTQKTLLTCLMGERSTLEAQQILNLNSVPVYKFPDQAGPVLRGMWAYKEVLERKPFEEVSFQQADRQGVRIARAAIGDRRVIGEYESRLLLDAYNIPNVPGGLARTAEEAEGIADLIGYPVVLKIVAEGLIHKSDAGGIVLNLQNAQELRVAYSELIDRINKNEPSAQIIGAMVEKMAAKGVEVIVGMRRDVTFGPLVMFGMGGTMVELIKDIQFRAAPLSQDDIKSMVAETMAGKLLNGFRGAPTGDFHSLYKVIAQLSHLAMAHPEIQEIEINPLIVYPEGEGVLAIDSRMILN